MEISGCRAQSDSVAEFLACEHIARSGEADGLIEFRRRIEQRRREQPEAGAGLLEALNSVMPAAA